MTLGLTTATATSALSRETPTKKTPKTAETHIEKHVKRLWVRIGETMKRLRSTTAGRWWLVWVSGGRKWVLGASKAVNTACLAVFDPSTNSALSRQPESVKKSHMGVYGPLCLTCTSAVEPLATVTPFIQSKQNLVIMNKWHGQKSRC